MKTGTVTIRLTEEKIEQLQRMAKEKGCSLSELVREKVLAQMEGTTGGNEELLRRLKEIEVNLAGGQQAMADLLLSILRNTVGARYHASLATTYADDIITVMQTGSVLSEAEAEKRQAMREKEAQRIEAATIAQAAGAKGERRA